MTWTFDQYHLYHQDAPVQLRGVGVGNWLLLESFMHGLPGLHSQMKTILNEELGPDRAERYWRRYEDSYFSEADIVHLAGLGCNCLRIPFHQAIFETEDSPGVYAERGFELLDRVFTWAERHQQWVLLDMHAVHGAQSTDWYADCIDGQAHFWRRPDLQRRATELWCAIAERYHGHPRLFGYDLLCEPVLKDAAPLNDYLCRTIAAIRNIDTTSVIQVEPNLWARDAASLADAVFADPLVMVHGHWYASQHLPTKLMQHYPQPHLGITDQALWDGMRSTLDQQRIRRPGMIGEYGLTHKWHIGGAQVDLLHAQARVLDEQGVHRLLWSAKDRGVMGVICPREDSPWLRFLAQAAIAEPLSALKDLTRCAFGANEGFIRSDGGELQKRCHALFPDLEGELVPRQVMECHRALDVLGLRHVARAMARLSDDELMACAGSFAYEHCRVHPDLAAVLAPQSTITA